MLYNRIRTKTREWLNSPDCTVNELIQYMGHKGNLRDTQIEAIETYLFMKIKGLNKPLWKLFSEGFFSVDIDLNSQNINQAAREYLSSNKAALALYEFSMKKDANNKPLLPELEKLIIDHTEEIDFTQIIKNIFYNVEYPDYLMSLPMGAGKTYLMAAFIYLDLYFAYNEPENKIFAHNFLVLIPSGLKSSIVPSLRTIENFDPTWVVPNPAASELKKMLKFEVLDEQKSAQKSNRARNPNAQKVNQCLPNPFGHVFVVNAEKVILDRLELDDEYVLVERTDDEKNRYANELRHLIGQIPYLTIMVDEVHHAATDDIKLRQVVNKWQIKGNITTVLGFTGTPYLSNPDQININSGTSFKIHQITNTVYYYPLITAIKMFLKKPTVKIGENLDRLQIIREGIKDFQNKYGDKIYSDGVIAKIAIYCSNIEVLEEEVYPFLTGDLAISPDDILKFHKGNKIYPQPEGSELEFRTLDLPLSNKKYILLVQVGKEGWDCPSLTGVILSQKGDSPKNMVLQTSCRCLRQVEPGKLETALIWLNDHNAQILNDQLKKEQHTSIEEINQINKGVQSDFVDRYSRLEYLKVPPVDFYQLKIIYQSIDEEKQANTKTKLQQLFTDIDNYKANLVITTAEIDGLDEGEIAIMEQTGVNNADYNQWLFDIAKDSFYTIKPEDISIYESELSKIFNKITYRENNGILWNDLYDLFAINGNIRLSFSKKRSLLAQRDIVLKNACLLVAEKLRPVEANDYLYPERNDIKKILDLDNTGESIETDRQSLQDKYELARKNLEEQGIGNVLPAWEIFIEQNSHSLAVRSKDKTFHYLPYNFIQSGFEKIILQKVLQLEVFKNMALEIYYNGEKGTTDFVINCYAKNKNNWDYIGRYTTDFLVIKRDDKGNILKVLMIETKGEGFKNDPVFMRKKYFVETEFLKLNKDKFGYKRFDFLYLEDGTDINNNLDIIINRIGEYFGGTKCQ